MKSPMRLWTIHPRYLDAQGLVALWRESLLAQNVLRGWTKGYKHHPQLARFRAASNPRAAIAKYLLGIHQEAVKRGYSFDLKKVGRNRRHSPLRTTAGQVRYEWLHLRRKLRERSPELFRANRTVRSPASHPSFRIVPGDVEPWERRASK